jgi:hypothetical protein
MYNWAFYILNNGVGSDIFKIKYEILKLLETTYSNIAHGMNISEVLKISVLF